MPDEWQARQATPAILQVSSSKHNAKKITTRVRGPFHQSITAILTEGKEKRSSLLNLHMLQSTCFGTCVCVCVWVGMGVCMAGLFVGVRGPQEERVFGTKAGPKEWKNA